MVDHSTVAPAVPLQGELIHHRLVHVLEQAESARHVSIEGAVTHRQLALVPCGEHQPSELVGKRHQVVPADAGLEILLGDVGVAPGERRLQHALVRLEDIADRKQVEAHAERAGERFGVFLRRARGERRRHRDADHVFAAERVTRETRTERGVDSAPSA